MDKTRMESMNLTAWNVERLAELFPNCVTETAGKDGKVVKGVNWDALRQTLGEEPAERPETYEFTWVGKREAASEAHRPTRKTLRPCPEESVNWDTTENLYIEGDNLEVLKLLQECYLGKIKIIYIDPPYNRNKDFIYDDLYELSKDEYELESGLYNEEGERLFCNTTSNGRFHSNWCNMIYPRLLLARNLLTDDGVIFISIDEKEVNNARNLCQEIFGSTNFAGEIIWKNSSKNDQAYISVQHEYILCYVKNKNYNPGKWTEEKEGVEEIFKAFEGFRKKYGTDWEAIHNAALAWYKQFNESNPIYDNKHYSWMDENGVYFPSDISGPNYGQYRYDVIHPVTGKVCKEPASGWRYPKETMEQKIAENLVCFGIDEKTIPNNKTYLKDTLFQGLTSVKYKDGRVASKYLTKLMDCNCFSNPKDISVLTSLFTAIGLQEGDIVLDFFSGSGTTADVVMRICQEQNIHLNYILIQVHENLERMLKETNGSTKQIIANGIKLCNQLHKPHNICEIGKERIRRAGARITGAALPAASEKPAEEDAQFSFLPSREESSPHSSPDVGFRVLKLDESNMNDVYFTPAKLTREFLDSMEQSIKPDRTDLDLLFGCLLEWGIPLSCRCVSEKIDGVTVWIYDPESGEYPALVACFEKEIPLSVIQKIARKHPLRAVFRDDSFSDSPAKINLGETFKMFSPDTKIKVL